MAAPTWRKITQAGEKLPVDPNLHMIRIHLKQAVEAWKARKHLEKRAKRAGKV